MRIYSLVPSGGGTFFFKRRKLFLFLYVYKEKVDFLGNCQKQLRICHRFVIVF